MTNTPKSKKQVDMTLNDSRWTDIVTRNPRAEGAFYYSVKTTGVYCRPTCASRLAKPENVHFYTTCEEAKNAGFRPCKRCKPDHASLFAQHEKMVEKVCRYIENAEVMPNLQALADYVKLSPYHFHRIFKMMTGLTPKAYAVAHRTKRIRKGLVESKTVTEAIIEAGYLSNARFYENSNKLLGMTPSHYRVGGKEVTIYFATAKCSLGVILVAKSEKGICAIMLGDDPNELTCNLREKFPQANLVDGDNNFKKTVATVIAFIETPSLTFNLPLDIKGTAFQQRVWNALRKIPLGSTASYTDIAKQIGSPKAVRAVAQACAANPVAVVIPCHRVVRHDGSLSGYRWGVKRKTVLLKRESKK